MGEKTLTERMREVACELFMKRPSDYGVAMLLGEGAVQIDAKNARIAQLEADAREYSYLTIGRDKERGNG